MILGLIILGLVMLLIFFGTAERFLRNLGIANWIAFVLVLALVIGAVIPNIRIGTRFTVNVSGFLIPIAIMILFEVLVGWGNEIARAIFSQIAVAAVVVMVRFIMPQNTAAMILTTSLVTGFLAGAVAYLAGQTRMSVVIATMGGIVVGDVVYNIIQRFVFNADAISLGTGGVFNAIVIALVFGLALLESVNAMLRAMNRKRVNSSSLKFEAGEDVYTRHEINSDKLDDAELDRDEANFGDYNNFFDDNFL